MVLVWMSPSSRRPSKRGDEFDLVSRHACYVAFVLITFSSSHDGEEVGMKRYVVALEKEERDELAGDHAQGLASIAEGDQRADSAQPATRASSTSTGRAGRPLPRSCASVRARWIGSRSVSSRRAWRRRSGGRQGRRPSYVRKADGEFEARLVALSCAEPPQGHSQWSLRLLADRVVELGHIDSVSHETVRRVLKKTQSSRGGASAG